MPKTSTRLVIVFQVSFALVAWEVTTNPLSGADALKPPDYEGALILNDGRIFSQARIVSIGKTEVAILHSGGLTNATIELVPLDVLARAHIANEEVAARRQASAEKAAEKYAEVEPERPEKPSGTPATKSGKAALASDKRQSQSAQLAKSQPTGNSEQRLLALKTQFPRKERISVPITNKRGNRNNVVATATTRTSRDVLGTTSETTISVPRKGPDSPTDVIEVDVPHADQYSDYQGWIRVATIQSLPKVIERIEDKIERDLVDLRRQQNSISSQSGSAQARLTEQWIDRKLRPYLAELKKLRVR